MRESYSGLDRRIWIYCVAAFINRAGAMVLPFLALYATQVRGYSTQDAGQLSIAFGVGSIFGAIVGGRIVSKWGAHRSAIGSLIFAGIAWSILPNIPTLTGLAIGVALAGLFNDAFRPAMMSALSSLASERNRPQAFAAVRTALNIGFSLGPAAGGFLAKVSYRLLFWVDGATCIAAALILATIRVPTRTVRSQPPGASIEQDDRTSLPCEAPSPSVVSSIQYLFFLVLCVLFGSLVFHIFFVLPIILEARLGFTEFEIGICFGLQGLAVSLFGMPVARVLRDKNPLRVAAVGTVLLSLSPWLLTLMPRFDGAILQVVLWAVGECLAAPFLTESAARMGAAAHPRKMGFFLAAFGSGWIFGPSTALWIQGRFDWEALWTVGSCLGVVLALAFTMQSRLLRTERET